MLDNTIKFNIFIMVKHFTIIHKNKFSLKLTITVPKTGMKCRQQYRILCLHRSDCLDCGILSCNSTWSLQQILLLLAFKWKQAA
jgi:formate hydrogenlyase subunit 6/NADH:ubiquinone oxidoreductase subunit I